MQKLDGRKLTHSQSEYIRIQSVKAVREGNKSPEEIIKTFGLHRSNIYKWLKIYDSYGYSGLQSSQSQGPVPKLTSKQKQQLYKYLQKNPLQLKFEYALWTIEMIVELIDLKFGVQYSTVQVGRILKAIGFSKQKPLERAYQQDPEKVKTWLSTEYPRIKSEAKKKREKFILATRQVFTPRLNMVQLGHLRAKRLLLKQLDNVKKLIVFLPLIIKVNCVLCYTMKNSQQRYLSAFYSS